MIQSWGRLTRDPRNHAYKIRRSGLPLTQKAGLPLRGKLRLQARSKARSSFGISNVQTFLDANRLREDLKKRPGISS